MACRAVLGVLIPTIALAEGPAWQVVSPQTGNHEPDHPSVRYSHTATLVGDTMVVTHGYYYGHDGSGPQWLDDTWSFHLGSEKWSRLVGRASGVAPHARMSHTAVAVNGAVVLFGGDDGGHLKEGVRGYKGTFLNDLWILDAEGGGWVGGWRKLQPNGVVPPPRAHHTAVLLQGGADMVVYGGIHVDDMWAYNIVGNRWDELQQASSHADGRRPGKRHGHAAVGNADGNGFYLFGGFRFADDAKEGERSGPLDDLWYYDLSSGAWTELVQSHPKGGRTYASLMLYGADLIAFAGANCHGSCTCFGDVWTFSVDGRLSSGGGGMWREFPVTEEPITRYKQTTVLYREALYTFGGESYKPYMYHNSVSRLPLNTDASRGAGMASTRAAIALGMCCLFTIVYVTHKRVQSKHANDGFKLR